jgi:hypothetical protein
LVIYEIVKSSEKDDIIVVYQNWNLNFLFQLCNFIMKTNTTALPILSCFIFCVNVLPSISLGNMYFWMVLGEQWQDEGIVYFYNI